MTTTTRAAQSGPVIALLAVAVAAPLVAAAGPAVAGPPTPGTGIQWQAPLTDSSWTYGNSLSYRADPRLSGGHVMTATSKTPSVCQVAQDAEGNPTGELRLVDVGLCTVSLHMDGDATHAPYDGVVTKAVAPRDVIVTCHDFQRASDEPNPGPDPVFSNLAPWDSPSDFKVEPASIPQHLAPGRWPVAVQASPPVDPDTGSPRYQVDSTPCALTVNPVLTVTGMPSGKTPHLTVDGRPVDGTRFVFPYGHTISYSVDPVLGGKATSPLDSTHTRPEAWFASAATGSSTGDTTLTYSTFGEQVAASPFLDFYKSLFMAYTFNQYGWTTARQYLVDGFNGVSGETRLTRLRDILTDLQRLIQNTTILYFGRTDYQAVKDSGDQLIAHIQLILDSGGLPTT